MRSSTTCNAVCAAPSPLHCCLVLSHADFLKVRPAGEWISRLGVDIAPTDGRSAVQHVAGLCRKVAETADVMYQHALPVAFIGAAGTGKTRAGLELARLVVDNLKEEEDISVSAVRRSVLSIDIPDVKGDLPKCPEFVALMLSNGATTDTEAARRMLSTELESSGNAAMLVVLHVDEFQEVNENTSALLRTCRDLVGDFVENRILIMPVLSGFDDSGVAVSVHASSYEPTPYRLDPFTLKEASQWARGQFERLERDPAEVKSPEFRAALQATGCVPRFVEDLVDAWRKFSADGPAEAKCSQSFSIVTTELVARYSKRYAALGHARVMPFVAALRHEKVRAFASVDWV